jgi:hypothetical protein
MQKYFNSDKEFIEKVSERALAKKKEKFERNFRQGEFKLGEHVRVRMASLYSNLRARIKAGIMKKTIVTYSPTVYRIAAVYAPAAGKMSYSSFTLKDKNEKLIIKSDGTPQRFRGNEMLHVDTGYTVHHEIDQTRADYLNQVKESGEVVEAEPEPVHVAKVKVPKPPIPFAQWKGAQWTSALKSNLYELHGGRFEILNVEYDRKSKRYVVISAEFSNVVQGKLVKGAEQFEIDLALCLSLCKNQIWFTGDMQNYVDEHLEVEEQPAEPETQNEIQEPEFQDSTAQPTPLDLQKSVARRNLFGVQGGHIRCITGRTYR